MTSAADHNLHEDRGFIGGHWVEADDGRTIDVINPATGALIGRIPAMGRAETAKAVDAAQAAFPVFAKLPAPERATILRRWADLMMSHRAALAAILTREQGKPLAEAMGEVGYAASFLSWFAEEAVRVNGDIIPAPNPRTRIMVLKQPVGVVAALTPWNFPLAMATRKLGPALATGCTVVLKPSELTPYSAIALMKLGIEAGLPGGVVNLVLGMPEAISDVIMERPEVRKISFTGSTRVGKLLAERSAPTLKRLSLELGGNAPFIVFDDADLDAAVAGVIASKFRNTGQTCVCANRIFVQSAVYEPFVERLVAAVRALRVGDGADPETTQGPLINRAALEKVERHVADAIGRGATVLCGGRRHASGGTFYEPTVLSEIADGSLLEQEETFGPVAPLFRFETESEVVARANATSAGLSAYFYAAGMARVMRVAEALEVGIVGVNEGIISTAAAPFGGVKESGYGREGSVHGVNDYLDMKYILLGFHQDAS